MDAVNTFRFWLNVNASLSLLLRTDSLALAAICKPACPQPSQQPSQITYGGCRRSINMTLRTFCVTQQCVRSLSLCLVGSNDPCVPPGLVVVKNLAAFVGYVKKEKGRMNRYTKVWQLKQKCQKSNQKLASSFFFFSSCTHATYVT